MAALWGTAAALDALSIGAEQAPARAAKQPIKKKRRVDAGAPNSVMTSGEQCTAALET